MIMSYVRTIALYLVLIVCVRLMGKRQIGEMEPTEFVVTMLLANLAAIPMQDGAIPLYSGLVPILTVLGSELVLSGLILYSVKFRQLLCGKPVILIENGKLMQDNLRRTRVTLDELTGHLREKDVLDITAVLAKGKGYRLAEGCTFPLLGYYKRRQALDSRTAGNGRLARNTLEKAIFNQSRRLVAEPAAVLDLILPSDLELKEPEE